MVAKQPHFSPKQVASALQASESSVKRWCDRGAISTVRTVGGHRRITLEALQSFLIESQRQLETPEALGLPNQVSTVQYGTLIPGGDDPDQVAFRDSLAAGDEAECDRIVQRLIASGSTRAEVVEWLITDAMHGIGEAWDCKNLDAYQERRGCGICTRLVYKLRSQLAPVAPGTPIAIGGTLADDPYELPTTMVELALRENGWNAINLGTNLPADSMLRAARDYQPRVVWLSISSISNPEQFVSQFNELAEGLNSETSLLVGGRALTDEIRPRLKYTSHCDNIRSLVQLANILRG
ncbi:MAG: cobalamin-dependent protein [Planctomycetota bacterium]